MCGQRLWDPLLNSACLSYLNCFTDLNVVSEPLMLDFIISGGPMVKVNDQCPFAQPYSLLKAQLAGHTTLICLPENQNQAASIVQQYARAKQSAPHNTAATFITPCFNRFHSTLLENKGMQRERVLRKGLIDSNIHAPLPFSVAVYSDGKLPQPRMSSLDTMVAFSQVFHGQLLPSYAHVTCLADSGATHAFCSHSFAVKHRLRMRPSGAMQTVRLVDNSSSLHILGSVNTQLQLGDARISFEAFILSGETAAFDFIQGDTVFSKYGAALRYNPKVLELNVKGLKHLVPSATYAA